MLGVLGALSALGAAAALSLPVGCSSDPPAPPTRATREQLLDPEFCKGCHQDHYREWSGSMHAYAAEDPVFRAMNARGQRLTGGALGDFCVKCHAPMAVRLGATKDGTNLDSVPSQLKGVTCYFCHTVDAVEGTHNNPLRLAGSQAMRGPHKDPVANAAHDSTYSELHDRDRAASSALCGSCHDIVNGHGTKIERTFTEWKGSVFALSGGATCQQCHMEQSAAPRPVASTAGAPLRRSHSHALAGVDLAITPWPEREDQKKRVQALLDSTLQTALCVGDDRRLSVVVDNVAAGHGFPSGSTPDRRVWFELRAFKGADVLYESGVVPDGASPVDTASDTWLLRDCLFDESGALTKNFWSAVRYESQQLSAQLTLDPKDPRFYQTHVYRTFPRGDALSAYPDKVTLRVRVQPIGLDVLDDLVAAGDLDPKHRAAMPTLDVGAPLEWTRDAAEATYFEGGKTPYRCVTKTNLNVQADKTLFPASSTCKP
jgi:hypothetical protein